MRHFPLMATPGELLDLLEALDLPAIVTEALDEQKESYVKKNLDQLLDGLSPEEGKIEPKYKSKSYARKKNAMNPKPGFGTPDFYLTGALHEQTHAEVEGDDLVIKSDVEYAKYNEQRWGNETIWGLTEENFEVFVDDELRPSIIEKVCDQTGLQ